MPNGNFQTGTWTQLPSNCTRDYALTFVRCAQWGSYAVSQCVSWVANATITCVQWAWQAVQTCVAWVSQTTQQCVNWAQQTSQQCCNWWPCSWACAVVMTIISWVCLIFEVVVTVACVVFAIVVTVFCALFAVIVTVACAIWAVLVYVFCALWSVISIIFCVSNANGGTAFVLTDGTVMMQECTQIVYGQQIFTRRWWKLTPDSSGSYVNGNWSRLADSNQARKYFASGVLADGRVLVCGGEYSDASGNGGSDTNTCEIYDQVANSWTVVTPPSTGGSNPQTWVNIGDAPCAVLPDGSFLMGNINTPDIAKLDPATLAWTAMGQRPVETRSAEESWVLMPDGTIAAPSCSDPGATWVYDIAADTWNQGNNLPTSIVPCVETGPALLRYDGTAFFLGANQHTAVYSAGANPAWINSLDLPAQSGRNIGVMDGPASMLTNGNVLFGAAPIDSQCDYESPDSYFEFDGTNFNRTSDPPNHNCPTFVTRLLLLPNGDALFAREDDSSFYAYRPASPSPQAAWRPVIQNCPAHLVAGSTVQVSGLQFNGLSQATAYGDDSSAATNYPLFRLTNTKTGEVRYWPLWIAVHNGHYAQFPIMNSWQLRWLGQPVVARDLKR